MFVNRRKELAQMNSYLDMILSGQNVNLSLFGQRRTGKTELLKRFKREVEGLALVPYLSLERFVPKIEHFSLHFIAELLRTASGGDQINLTWPSMLINAQSIGKREQEAIASLIELLEKETKDVGAVAELLFKLPRMVSEDMGLPIIYIIDEFQEITVIHDRILHIMRANTEKGSSVNFWVAGSVFTAFNALFDGESPFFGQFERMELARFEQNSTYELIDGLLPFDISPDDKKIIYRSSGGHPFYITAICRRFHLMSDITDHVDSDLLKKSIIMEVFDKTGAINAHFEYLLDVSLARFRNIGMHHNILLHISNEPDNLSGISSVLGKPSGEVSNYMKGLLRTDLVSKKEDTYFINDPLMGAWLSNKYSYMDHFSIFDTKVREKVFEDLLERYSQISTELGKAKEVELRDRLGSKYDLKLKPYSTKDGQIELDLVGEKEGYHIFEIKWRNRPVDIRTVKRFHSKVQKSKFPIKEVILYMISRGGFDRKAMKYAMDQGIVCLDRSLNELEDMKT